MPYHYIGPPSPEETARRQGLIVVSQSRVARLHRKPHRERPAPTLSAEWKDWFYEQIEAVRRKRPWKRFAGKT
jgi:hypothetical protein